MFRNRPRSCHDLLFLLCTGLVRLEPLSVPCHVQTTIRTKTPGSGVTGLHITSHVGWKWLSLVSQRVNIDSFSDEVLARGCSLHSGALTVRALPAAAITKARRQPVAVRHLPPKKLPCMYLCTCAWDGTEPGEVFAFLILPRLLHIHARDALPRTA